MQNQQLLVQNLNTVSGLATGADCPGHRLSRGVNIENLPYHHQRTALAG